MHGSETWILIGFEFDSSFSVRATFRPNRQYLQKLVLAIFGMVRFTIKTWAF